ncbi:MAG TPA: phage baseplate assembly protein V, partial [Isosphaeraceae bacterium]
IWAGRQWGAIHIPRIGQEVIVAFEEGDPDQPIIVGSVYNAEQMPPFGLPEKKVVSGIKSQAHQGAGYNEMTFDDTAGQEKITVHGLYDMNTTVEHDDSQTVHNNRTISVDGTHTETIKKDTKITITEGTCKHDVAANTASYHVKGALTEKYDDTQTTTVTKEIAITSESAHIYIHAATSIQLHVGGSKLWMAEDGRILLEGANIAIKGSESVSIKGGSIRSEADQEHEIKGAIVKSDGSAQNTVKGGVVLLNP